MVSSYDQETDEFREYAMNEYKNLSADYAEHLILAIFSTLVWDSVFNTLNCSSSFSFSFSSSPALPLATFSRARARSDPGLTHHQPVQP